MGRDWSACRLKGDTPNLPLRAGGVSNGTRALMTAGGLSKTILILYTDLSHFS